MFPLMSRDAFRRIRYRAATRANTGEEDERDGYFSFE